MIERLDFLKRSAGMLAGLTVLSPEELIGWHDEQRATDFDRELGLGDASWPITFWLIDDRDREVAEVETSWNEGVLTERPPGLMLSRRWEIVFTFEVEAWHDFTIAGIAHRLRDGGVWEVFRGRVFRPWPAQKSVVRGDTITVNHTLWVEG